MNARKISQYLRQGLGYSHIADAIGETPEKVSAYVRENLPAQARPTKGRVPAVIADRSFLSRFNAIGAVALATELGVSLSAVYRAKHRCSF